MNKTKRHLCIVILSKNNPEELIKTLESIAIVMEKEISELYILGIDKSEAFASIESLYQDRLSLFSFEVHQQKSSGIYNAFNEAIDICNSWSKWIYFLNSGDYMLPGFIDVFASLSKPNTKSKDFVVFPVSCMIGTLHLYNKPARFLFKYINKGSFDRLLRNKSIFASVVGTCHQGVCINLAYHSVNLYSSQAGLKADAIILKDINSCSTYFRPSLGAAFNMDGVSSIPWGLHRVPFIGIILAYLRLIRYVIIAFACFLLCLFCH